MQRLVSTSGFLKRLRGNVLFQTGGISYGFSTMPPNLAIQKAVEYQYRFRTIVKLQDLYKYIVSESEGIKKYGKTILLQFLNEYPMQSFRRSRDQLDQKKRKQNHQLRYKLYIFLNDFENLNFYEMNLRYSIFKKMLTYIGHDDIIEEMAQREETALLDNLKSPELHFLDVINWLYMLPLGYTQNLSTVAFDLMEKQFQNPQVRQYLKNQRSLPMLIKRIFEKDWSELRNYKNILKFLSHQATLKSQENLQNLAISLERICTLKLHMIGDKVIPKILDQIIERFNNEFQALCKNKLTLLKVFSCFKYLPLNYNVAFFNRIHNYFKSVTELPSHCLLYLPYNKLTQNEVSFLQTKMFTSGRQDIASKLIYTVYAPEYKQIFTPFLIKEAYNNLLDIWKKETFQDWTNFQVYVALFFRFSRMNSPIIDHSRIRKMVFKFVDKVEERKYDIFTVLSLQGIVAFFELCKFYDLHINEKYAISRAESVFSSRKEKNSASYWAGYCLLAVKVNFNANSRVSRQMLTSFMHDIIYNKEVEKDKKAELLFLIEKTLRPEPKWLEYSAKLYREMVTDVNEFVEDYIKYDSKTLKLTNFVFGKLYEQKVELHVVMELLSSLHLKLVTSLKGRLITPLKKYITELDATRFDLSQSSLSSLIHSFRILFYFRHQIPQFMQHMALSIIKLIEQKQEQQEYINGKQFASLSCYIMEVLAGTDVKLKADVIASIASIIKAIRKKEGLYMKVYELDFLASHQKFIRVNSDVLDNHWSQILQTLKKTDRIENHKDLFLISLKLHCLQLIEMNSYDLRYFIDKCTHMVEDSVINLAHIKEALGYEILNCDDQFAIEKMKLFLSNIIKLAFRREQKKQNFFMYEYYLKLFSKLQESDMVIEICKKLLYEKLYPVEVANVLPILNHSEIKSKKFALRILDIMKLADAYVTVQKMQVISWLDKIYYELKEEVFGVNSVRAKVNEEITAKVLKLKEEQKKLLTQQERSVQEGFEVQDPNFDRHYKMFIDYAWSCIKLKQVDSSQFKYICRYLFFSIDKIKARIENPQQRKQISKIKLYHVFKYMKESGFFVVDEEKYHNSVREEGPLKEKIRKGRLLGKMENYLTVMKFEQCPKLQKRLAQVQGIQFKHKAEIKLNNPNRIIITEYMITQGKDSSKKFLKNPSQFIIHTVKRYHCIKEVDASKPDKIQTQAQDAANQKLDKKKQEQSKLKQDDDDILGFEEVEDGEEQANNDLEDDLGSDFMKDDFLELQESKLSLEMKPEKNFGAPKEPKQPKVIKPLFGGAAKKKTSQQLPKKEKDSFKTCLKLQPQTLNLYEDYNGYLKVEKSLIELISGKKCIIYDPERDIFFD